MKEIYNNIIPEPVLAPVHERFFRMSEPPYGRTREQIWSALEARMDVKAAPRVVRFRSTRMLAAAAAVMVLLLSTFMVMRYHTVTTTAGDGQLLSCSLPDGSKVELNAGSTLAYHPYWWSFSRNLEFEGEGYFEVEKGKRFRVGSAKGTTEVLGTSFTIYARADEYRVACLTGKVRVESAAGEKTVLIPGHSANIESDGSITIGIIENSKAAASWIKGMFSFNARPLRLVLEEIQRQYGIAVSFEDNGEYRFTGYFAKEKPVEEVLELVCKPFGLNFVKHSDTAFEILKN